MDEDVKAQAIEGDVPKDVEASCKEASEACPVSAIIIS
jgi:ferredoxin